MGHETHTILIKCLWVSLRPNPPGLLEDRRAILHYELAAERAAKRFDVQGPGTFIPAFIDELYSVRLGLVQDQGWSILDMFKVEILTDVQDQGLLKEL